MSKIDELINKGKLKKAKFSKEMIRKELSIGKEDLKTAKYSFETEAYKWATIQGYYALFHAIRALVFKAGYREESHAALKVAFDELYIKTELLGKEILSALERGMMLRESADYKATFSISGAQTIIKISESSIQKIEEYLDSIVLDT